MGTAIRTDGWNTDQPVPGEPSAEQASPDATTVPPARARRRSLAATIAAWAEAAFGPAASGVGRELNLAVRKLTAPGQLERPWVWIGAAGLLGYGLGRARALRPLASFTARAVLTTLVERALRVDN